MSQSNTPENTAILEKIYALEKQLIQQKKYTLVAREIQKKQQEELEELLQTKHSIEREVFILRQEKKDLSYTLSFANTSHAKQIQLLMTELEKVQKLLAYTYEELGKTQKQLEHMHRTLSWRITKPLRTLLPHHIFRRSLYVIFGALKDLWIDFGKPFPQLVVKIRYGFFSKIPPKNQ